MDAIITVDVEADGAWSYDSIRQVTVENLQRLPRFQELCDRFGMKPTYLCTWEVAKHHDFRAMVEWQRQGRAEIGAHLHPWTNPPFSTAGARDFDPAEYPAYPLELSLDHFHAKMARLTELIAERSGRAPTSYRAGRWGMAAAHVPILVELGYIVDCSVTPLVNRQRNPGIRVPGPDYRTAPVVPYRLSPHDLCTPGTSALLEVPMTIVQPRALLRRSLLARNGYDLLKKMRASGVLHRLVGTEPTWLRPYPRNSAKMLREVLAVATEMRLPVVEMMLHSSELLPGASESYATEVEVERQLAMVEDTFAAMRARAIEGVTLSDFAQQFMAGAHAPRVVPRRSLRA
jgi:hypothetical protein